jgi:adenylate cyclase
MEAGSVSAGVRRPAEARHVPERVALATRIERRIAVASMVAHAAGALDVAILLFWALPEPSGIEGSEVLTQNIVAVVVYFTLALTLGLYLGKRLSPRRRAWVLEGRPPTAAERQAALRLPMDCVRTDGALWLGGVAVFTAVNAADSADLAFHVASTVAMGGLATCAIAYLLAERFARPIIALALAQEVPARPTGPGVTSRLILAWAAATAVPVGGMIFVGLHGLEDGAVASEISRAVITLAVMALGSGLVATVLVAKSVAEPLSAVRRGLARVQAGDLSTEVPVSDGSEVGLLQSGFNRMAAGLRERERMEELFSRSVGEDVARQAMEGDPRLGGEERDVAVLFVDLVGFTAFTASARPERVVSRLNTFFAGVVDVVGEHGGWVNKFEGDAALCIFGAPAPMDDPAGRALAAARDLCTRLEHDLPGMEAGIGLSAGPVVAGWIGATRRFEYTVVGDPVNEAARLCELAKSRPGRLLASEAIVTRAHDEEERRRWRIGEALVLRGRSAATRLAAPV